MARGGKLTLGLPEELDLFEFDQELSLSGGEASVDLSE